MVNKVDPKPETKPRLSCEQCCQEIPYSPENVDYVVFFCGTECYREWSAKTPNLRQQKVYVQNSKDGEGAA